MTTAWKKALEWTTGLDHALAVMLASISSTKIVGDQLWCKILGPASCGKSTLCEAVSLNKKYILAKSTIRGFHSGFRMDDGSGTEQDHSLVARVRDKTLVTKDGDTLLQSPNLAQILSEARDLYDCTSRTHYRNAMSKDYEGVRMTWLLCGTSSLRQIDSSELGERFLDCVIMEGIDSEQEDKILWHVINRTDRNSVLEANGRVETHYEPELATAMQLTGGYVGWLRENVIDKMSEITLGTNAKKQCMKLGKFVAFMRARPSTRQEETAEREFAARLVSQLGRLAKCLALVLNRDDVDNVVMRRVKRVAMDTARGQTLVICKCLYEAGEEGIEPHALAVLNATTDEKMNALMRFLRRIEVVESFQKKVKGVKKRKRFKLTEPLYKLYGDVEGV